MLWRPWMVLAVMLFLSYGVAALEQWTSDQSLDDSSPFVAYEHGADMVSIGEVIMDLSQSGQVTDETDSLLEKIREEMEFDFSDRGRSGFKFNEIERPKEIETLLDQSPLSVPPQRPQIIQILPSGDLVLSFTHEVYLPDNFDELVRENPQKYFRVQQMPKQNLFYILNGPDKEKYGVEPFEIVSFSRN